MKFSLIVWRALNLATKPIPVQPLKDGVARCRSRMFRGSSYQTIDLKGRIIVPARFRERIVSGGGNVVVSRLDNCLVAYPESAWQKVEAKIESIAVRSPAMRRFRRIFAGSAAECTCDKQNRILIPPALREYAMLQKDIVLAGVLSHFEIWARENWVEEEKLMETDMADEAVRNEISALGL